MDAQLGTIPAEIHKQSQRDLAPEFESDVHYPIWPEDIRETDRVLARLRIRDSDHGFRAMRVWRISPLGVELVETETSSLEKGTPIDLELIVAGHRNVFEGLVVEHTVAFKDGSLLAIRLHKKIASRTIGSERRSGQRWLCSEEFLPSAIAPTPGRLDDFIYFQIRDISADGLQLSCSLRNKFLVPGMKLALVAVFPMGQSASVNIVVARVSIRSFSGRDRLIIGARFNQLTGAAKSVIGQYLIQFGDLDSLDDLRSAGLAPKRASLGVDFYNLKTEPDYLGVLELRHLAHSVDHNLRDGALPWDLADLNDAKSRIIVGKFRGKIIATSRVRFPAIDDHTDIPWSKTLPRRDHVIEVSRVATHPEFRRNDLLAALFRYSYLSVVQSERPWVVISCLDGMVGFYQRLGFRKAGLRYIEPYWRDDRVLNVMIANVHDIIVGRAVSPIYWCLVWRDLAEHYSAQKIIQPSSLDYIRMVAYRMLGFLSIAWRSRSLRPSRSSEKA